jgi:cytochrome P450 / NADPH-cytochrome P450 reductase
MVDRYTAVLRETLRQSSPISQRSTQAMQDTILEDGGKRYAIPKDQMINVLNMAAHFDTAVYGDDVRLRRLSIFSILTSQ